MMMVISKNGGAGISEFFICNSVTFNCALYIFIACSFRVYIESYILSPLYTRKSFFGNMLYM